MTTIVEPPAVQVERLTRPQIAAHLLDDSLAHHLPYPMTVQMTSPGRVAVFFERDSERDEWAEFLGSPWASFHGVSIGLYSTQAAAEEISRVERIRRAVAFADVEPAAAPTSWCELNVKPTDDDTRTELTAARCAATWYGAPCPGEDIQADGRCTQHTGMQLGVLVEFVHEVDGRELVVRVDDSRRVYVHGPSGWAQVGTVKPGIYDVASSARRIVEFDAAPARPVPYLPASMPTGDAANRATVAALAAADLDEPTQQLPDLHADRLRAEHGSVQIVDVTDDPEVTDLGRGDPEIARMTGGRVVEVEVVGMRDGDVLTIDVERIRSNGGAR